MSLIHDDASVTGTHAGHPPSDFSFNRNRPAQVDAERGDCWFTLSLRHGGQRTVRVAYESAGPANAPCVLVLGGISAHRHLAASRRYPESGWWPGQVGIGKALDPQRMRLLGIDWLGADGQLDAPLDTTDQADAIAAVLDALGIRRLRALIGASYGALVGLQFAARHGERLRHLLAICGAHRPHPYSSAWRSVQRAILRLAATGEERHHAVAVARQLAVLSYRSPAEFAARFDAPATRCGDRFEVAGEAYLRHQGERFSARFCATAFERLSESIDLHRVDPGHIHVPTTVVGVHEDRLVPLDDLRQLVEALAAPARLVTLHSLYGHDAFLKEDDAIAGVITWVLADAAAEVSA